MDICKEEAFHNDSFEMLSRIYGQDFLGDRNQGEIKNMINGPWILDSDIHA